MKQKLSIGVFSEMLSETNGTAEAARRLVIGLGKAGHDVHVFAPCNGVAGKDGITFHKAWGFRMSREPEFHFSLPLIKYFNCTRGFYKELDLCHAITPMTVGALGLDVAKMNGIPKLVTHHSPLAYYAGDYFPVIGKMFSLYAWKYERLFYNRFHAIHVPTLSKKHLILEQKLREPIFALTNGILDNYFKRTPGARGEVLEFYKIPADKKIMLYAGRQGPEKNVESIVRALRKVRDAGVDAHLILAGGGPHIPVLREYGETLGVGEHLTQTGWIHHLWLRKVYDAADVSTLYNDIEAQGLVLLEAMAQGTPCVGKNANGIKDVIIDGKTGFLVNNEDEFANRLVQILRDDELQRRLGVNALDEVTRNHKMSNVVAVWERVYKFLIDVVYPRRFFGATEEDITQDMRDFCAREPLLRM